MNRIRIKAVINECYGGFSLSKEAILRMRELGSERAKQEPITSEIDEYGQTVPSYRSYGYHFDRTDPILIQVVEEMGKQANGNCSELSVKEYDIQFAVNSDDGMERGTIEWHEL